jgi:hypothetical protein
MDKQTSSACTLDELAGTTAQVQAALHAGLAGMQHA